MCVRGCICACIRTCVCVLISLSSSVPSTCLASGFEVVCEGVVERACGRIAGVLVSATGEETQENQWKTVSICLK